MGSWERMYSISILFFVVHAGSMVLFCHVYINNRNKFKNYSFRVDSNCITSISNPIQIRRADFELNHADGQTDAFISFTS
jgi:hypothetical protein